MLNNNSIRLFCSLGIFCFIGFFGCGDKAGSDTNTSGVSESPSTEDTFNGSVSPSDPGGYGGSPGDVIIYRNVSFSGECVGSVRRFYSTNYNISIPFLGANGGAYLLWSSIQPSANQMTQISKSGNVPQIDDLIVWDVWASPPYEKDNPYGHVAVAVSLSGNTLTVVDSNWVAPYTGGIHTVKLDDPRILGWYRPISGSTTMQEICDGTDNNSDGVVDSPDCFITIYRFVDLNNGARCLGPSTSAPQACSNYQYEREAFIMARQASPITASGPMRQCSKLTDHIIVPYNSADFNGLKVAGYNCDLELGYVLNSNTGSGNIGDSSWRICPIYRFSFTASGLGAHLFTTGLDDMSNMSCEPPSRGGVLTTQTCFSDTPVGCQ